MNKTDKMRDILKDELKQKGMITTSFAQQRLDVSESTVRRLFNRMAECGEVSRIYGGIRLVDPNSLYEYDATMERRRTVKIAIGKCASLLVSDNDSIYIDCGTTTIHLCKFLVERLKRRELSNVTVVTNSVTHMEIMEPYCATILTGGIYHANRKSFAGASCEKFLSAFHFDIAFLGADGLSLEAGFSTSEIETSHLTEVVSTLADKTYVLLDCSKIGKRSFIVYDNFKYNKRIITDSGIQPEDLQRLQEKGLEVLIAKSDQGI